MPGLREELKNAPNKNAALNLLKIGFTIFGVVGFLVYLSSSAESAEVNGKIQEAVTSALETNNGATMNADKVLAAVTTSLDRPVFRI